MPDLQINTRGGAGATTTLHAAHIDTLQESLDGRLLFVGSDDYDQARTIWNAMIDRRPAMIVRCATSNDVARAIDFGRENNLVIAVRGGGHNIAGNAVCDGGLMIDLSQMRTVEVDSSARVARVGGGATLAELDEATAKHNLVTPLGINSTTGVAGLTLGGGFGWLTRKYGLSCDNLISAEVVTPDGSIVRASESENSDLLWGLRGGGGNFGVVTRFDFRLHDFAPQVMAGMIVHPIEAAHEVVGFWRDYVKNAPDEFAAWMVMRQAPPAPFIPVEWHGREVVILAICVAGPLDEAERLVKPFRTLGKPIADIVSPFSYVDWQKILDAAQTPGARNYWKSNDFNDVPEGLIDVMLDYAHRLPDPNCDMAIALLGGAVQRVPADATAYGRRDPLFTSNIHGRWIEPAKDADVIAWTRSLNTAMGAYSTGSVYVNFMTEEETDRVRAAYGPNYDRLVALKNKYDPTNLLHFNQNIHPTPEVEGRG